MSLLLNMLSRLVITFLPRSKHLLISWLKSSSAVILEPQKIKSDTVSSGHVWMWELDCEESWVLKNWYFWTVLLEKTLKIPLDCKEIQPIQPVHPKGNQPWIFIGSTDAEAKTPILWPPDVKSWLIWKDPDAGKNWGHEEKGVSEDKIVSWMATLTQWTWVWEGSRG